MAKKTEKNAVNVAVTLKNKKFLFIEEDKLPNIIRKAFALVDQTNNLNEKIGIIINALKKEFKE